MRYSAGMPEATGQMRDFLLRPICDATGGDDKAEAESLHGTRDVKVGACAF